MRYTAARARPPPRGAGGTLANAPGKRAAARPRVLDRLLEEAAVRCARVRTTPGAAAARPRARPRLPLPEHRRQCLAALNAGAENLAALAERAGADAAAAEARRRYAVLYGQVLRPDEPVVRLPIPTRRGPRVTYAPARVRALFTAKPPRLCAHCLEWKNAEEADGLLVAALCESCRLRESRRGSGRCRAAGPGCVGAVWVNELGLPSARCTVCHKAGKIPPPIPAPSAERRDADRR